MNKNILSLLLQLILIMIIFPSVLFAEAEKIFRNNHKAVVVIVTYDNKGNAISQGSGFIARSDGGIITNYHVISKAADIEVMTGSKILQVEGLLYVDKASDIVLLKARGKGLPVVKLADMDKVKVGDKIYVISSPKGLENTISDGILSGIREIDNERRVLQITAPISAGSSGGPVFNKHGEVIGIATFIIKGSQNLNFALPVNLIKDKLSRQRIITLEDSGVAKEQGKDQYWFYSESEGETEGKEELYLFILDFVQSLFYINESKIGTISYTDKKSDEIIASMVTFDKNKLAEAKEKIAPWSRSGNIKIRRVSENMPLRIKELFKMEETTGQYWMQCAAKMLPRETCKAYYDLFFLKNEKGDDSGAFYKLMDAIDRLSFELFSIVTNGGVTVKGHSLVMNDKKISFVLPPKQLKEIYSYIEEHYTKRKIHSKENDSSGRANIHFSLSLTMQLICNYIKDNPSALDECRLE